ncbi:hypothetical protein Bbelb_407850 [Branchiostoma belcheri]|nr:hypothetical protein Bbelb_407850 [Branchiostoma belcheri]
MATKQGKKVKVGIRTLFSRRRKRFSRPKDQVRLLKELEEPITVTGAGEEENNELTLNLNLKTIQTSVNQPRQQPKRRSVKLDVGDLLYGGRKDRESEPSSSGHTATYSGGEERTRPGEPDQDLDLRLVTKDDGQDNSWISAKTTKKVFTAQLHSDSGAGGKTQPGENVRNPANSGAGNSTRPGKDRKLSEGKSKKKRKKVSFSATSTKYIQLEASQEALDVCVVEEQTIKKKKSNRKKKMKERIRKAARLSWRYLVAGFRNMTMVTPFYVTSDTMQSVYSPQYNTSLVTPMYMTSYTGDDGYTQRYP